jgi:pimeloyl-ACP methyl ester carboxylesterase
MSKRFIAGILLLGLACAVSAAPTPIREQSFVRIGGIEQWITINGTDGRNPVVLFIHGGPGNAMSAYADTMFAGWDKEFTLVQWDQRGAGKTFGRSGPSIEPTLTIDRMAMDGVEVAEYLTKHLHKKRVVLVGSSWGSLLGVCIVKRKPELFQAYIGTAQLVSMRENFAASYRRVLEHAQSIGDKPAIDELLGAGPPPWNSVPKWRTFRKWRNDYQRRLATTPPLTLVRSPGYTSAQDLADDEAADDLSFAHFNFVGTSMTGPFMDIDLKKLGAQFPIPVYVIHGAADLNAVPEIAREYVDWIRAPAKEFILVPESGHMETPASLAVLFGVLTHQVRAAVENEKIVTGPGEPPRAR